MILLSVILHLVVKKTDNKALFRKLIYLNYILFAILFVIFSGFLSGLSQILWNIISFKLCFFLITLEISLFLYRNNKAKDALGVDILNVIIVFFTIITLLGDDKLDKLMDFSDWAFYLGKILGSLGNLFYFPIFLAASISSKIGLKYFTYTVAILIFLFIMVFLGLFAILR